MHASVMKTLAYIAIFLFWGLPAKTTSGSFSKLLHKRNQTWSSETSTYSPVAL